MLKTEQQKLEESGVIVPYILIPDKDVDLEKWAVIACDQFTQDRGYWQKVEEFVGGAPSSLRLIFPEVYLESKDKEERIKAIHSAMRGYLDNKYFRRETQSCIFVERETHHGKRPGLIIAIDLERYDYSGKSKTLVRPTEETIISRIPPRVAVREGAMLECSHIMLLINDEKDTLMSSLKKVTADVAEVYSTKLILGGGSIKAKPLSRKNDWSLIADALEHLRANSLANFGNEFLFAVGDGNHSLATAKTVWENFKKKNQSTQGIENHPLRYALVEIVNLYDPALVFEPIHRLLFNIEIEKLLSCLKTLPGFSLKELDASEELKSLVCDSTASSNRYGIFNKSKFYLVETNSRSAATVDLEPILLNLVEKGGASGEKAAIDYIHGEDALFKLVLGASGAEENEGKGGESRLGVLLPPFRRGGFFKNIAENGPLPRKSFSIGDAQEKRYYLECRKLSTEHTPQY